MIHCSKSYAARAPVLLVQNNNFNLNLIKQNSSPALYLEVVVSYFNVIHK